jgi:hypothetical protein
LRLEAEYQFCHAEGWDLLVLSERWSQGLWDEISHHLRDQAPADHPQMKQFHYPPGRDGEHFYLKIYHRSHPLGNFKDLFRDSKAFRALKQGKALRERGFHVPLPIAAGEERKFRFLKRAFLLTLGIEGSPLPLFLREHCSLPLSLDALRKKRDYIKELAMETRRLHQCGFVHGDLVPSNILVQPEGRGVTFFYIDNDRTRHYPVWLPHILWRRNLVQLNRFVLPGISLQDRMRFLRLYLEARSWGRRERRLIRWLEEKTRQRRQECDRITAQVSFRELMRWNGPFTRNIE